MDQHSQNKPQVNIEGTGNVPASVDGAQNSNLNTSVSSDVREIIGALPPEQSRGTTAGTRQQLVTKTPQERKAELLARLPKDQDRAEKYMKRQVTVTLKKQLSELEGQLHHTSNLCDLNLVMAKIRRYREILADLLHTTFEQLKSFWLQFVHGLSI